MQATKRIFSSPVPEGNEFVIEKHWDVGIAEQKLWSFNVPHLIAEPRVKTTEEYEAVDYHKGVSDKRYQWADPDDKSKRIFAFMNMSTEFQQKHDLLELGIQARNYLLDPKILARFQGGKKKVDGIYNLGISVQHQKAARTIKVGSISIKDTDHKYRDFIDLCLELSNKALAVATGSKNEAGERMRYLKGALVPGPLHNNENLSKMQVNLVTPGDVMMDEEHGKFVAIHTDHYDAATGHSVLLNLSWLDEDYFPGSTTLTSPRVSFTSAPLEILVMSGRFYHLSTGASPYSPTIAKDSHFRLSKDPLVPDPPPGTPFIRSRVILYPNAMTLEPKFWWIHPELYTEAAQTVMPVDAHQQWMMLTFIQNETDIRSRSMAFENIGDHYFRGSGPQRLIVAADSYYKAFDRKPPKFLSAKHSKAQNANSSGHDESHNKEKHFQAESVRLSRTRKRDKPAKVLTPEALEATKIPKGDGLGLTKAQQTSLMVLTAMERFERASRVYTIRGKLRAGFKDRRPGKVKADEEEAEKKSEFAELAKTLTRIRDPNYYVDLFAWMDPVTKEVHYPSKAVAQEALDNFGKTNKELDELGAKMRKLRCGNASTGKQLKDGTGKREKLQVKWTHGPETDMVSSFMSDSQVSIFQALDTQTAAVEHPAPNRKRKRQSTQRIKDSTDEDLEDDGENRKKHKTQKRVYTDFEKAVVFDENNHDWGSWENYM